MVAVDVDVAVVRLEILVDAFDHEIWQMLENQYVNSRKSWRLRINKFNEGPKIPSRAYDLSMLWSKVNQFEFIYDIETRPYSPRYVA